MHVYKTVARSIFGVKCLAIYEASVPISLTIDILHKKYCKMQTPSRHVLFLAEIMGIERDQELHFSQKIESQKQSPRSTRNQNKASRSLENHIKCSRPFCPHQLLAPYKSTMPRANIPHTAALSSPFFARRITPQDHTTNKPHPDP